MTSFYKIQLAQCPFSLLFRTILTCPVWLPGLWLLRYLWIALCSWLCRVTCTILIFVFSSFDFHVTNRNPSRIFLRRWGSCESASLPPKAASSSDMCSSSCWLSAEVSEESLILISSASILVLFWLIQTSRSSNFPQNFSVPNESEPECGSSSLKCCHRTLGHQLPILSPQKLPFLIWQQRSLLWTTTSSSFPTLFKSAFLQTQAAAGQTPTWSYAGLMALRKWWSSRGRLDLQRAEKTRGFGV